LERGTSSLPPQEKYGTQEPLREQEALEDGWLATCPSLFLARTGLMITVVRD